MKKEKTNKRTLVLDVDEPSAFEDMAFLLFHTTVPNYAFVDDLNHLYGLSLSRTADIELMNSMWPMFTYRDPLRHLTYHLIERPTTSAPGVPHWGFGEKLLLVKGACAEETATYICNDFSMGASASHLDDLRAASHASILDYYQQSLTSITLYDPLSQLPTSKKNARERVELEALLADIADNIDLAGE